MVLFGISKKIFFCVKTSLLKNGNAKHVEYFLCREGLVTLQQCYK